MKEKLHRSWKQLIILIVIIAVLAFIFFPRNLKTMIANDENIDKITLFSLEYPEDPKEIVLTDTQAEEFLKLLDQTYLYLNPFPKTAVSGDEGYIGCLILLDYDVLVNYFTEDIISINGIQYRLYGNDFAEVFLTYLDH